MKSSTRGILAIGTIVIIAAAAGTGWRLIPRPPRALEIVVSLPEGTIPGADFGDRTPDGSLTFAFGPGSAIGSPLGPNPIHGLWFVDHFEEGVAYDIRKSEALVVEFPELPNSAIEYALIEFRTRPPIARLFCRWRSLDGQHGRWVEIPLGEVPGRTVRPVLEPIERSLGQRARGEPETRVRFTIETADRPGKPVRSPR